MSEPGADLQYLQHSGWIVRTANHVLVFDYVERLPSGAELAASLLLGAQAFDERRVVVFVSHGHADHFDPTVFEWSQERPDIEYVLGSLDVERPGVTSMQPREKWSSGGLVVRTTGSTDQGVGFLVAVDGLVLFHAGDHAIWTEIDREAFIAEIQWLRNSGPPIDVALFAIATGAACDPRPSIWEGVRDAALLLAPRVLIPMHVGCPDRLNLYGRFRAEVEGQLPATQVFSPKRLGEAVRYADGKVEAPP